MTPYWHNIFERLQEMEGSNTPNPFLRTLAATLAALYGLGARGRRGLYARGLLKTKRLPSPVVSVGNLAVGGTGKTPMVACLARLFQEQGKKVAILSRGYGGQKKGTIRLSDGANLFKKPPEVGEEAYWLARALPGVAVYTGASRYRAGLAAWEEFRPDLFLLDDGFQHFQLHRDWDIVLLDAAAPFGNACLMPRGPLREPVSVLAAAHLFILTRFQEGRDLVQLQALRNSFPDKTVITAAIEAASARCWPGGPQEPPETLKGRALFAFSGLARPQAFAQTLAQLGLIVTGNRAFPDHYRYKQDDLESLTRTARALGAEALITTTKDWARLGETWEADLPLWVLEVEARLHQQLPMEMMTDILGGGPGS